MVTTIQLSENVKSSLDRLKSKKETYEDVIVNLMRCAEENKKEQEQLLIEGCKEMAEDMIRINKEWEVVDADIDWEW
jgi:predicted CopG family antitoxin